MIDFLFFFYTNIGRNELNVSMKIKNKIIKKSEKISHS
jgi:hypothetical protein